MEKEKEYWEGLAVGILAGFTAAAFIRWERIKPLLLPALGATPRFPLATPLRPGPRLAGITEIPLRRDHPESAGDPSRLSSAATPSMQPVFERAGGAPSPNTPAELIGTPGRPGHTRDLSDPTLPVAPAPRTVHINKGY